MIPRLVPLAIDTLAVHQADIHEREILADDYDGGRDAVSLVPVMIPGVVLEI